MASGHAKVAVVAHTIVLSRLKSRATASVSPGATSGIRRREARPVIDRGLTILLFRTLYITRRHDERPCSPPLGSPDAGTDALNMLTIPQQATAALHYIRHLLSQAPEDAALIADPAFSARLEHHFVTIFGIFTELYGYRVDCLDNIVQLIRELAQSWHDRPADMKAIDEARDKDPEWFLSNKMLGGVCYVDRYANNLAGIKARIPYFQELGLTYLHLMPVFLAPQPLNDGGYAVSSYRDVDPRLGSIEELKDLATALRKAGISLVIDFVFNHTSNEHEWARKAMEGSTEHEGFYWIFPDRTVPSAFEQTT